MPDYSFRELVDLEQVRQLLETHHQLSKIAYGLSDPDGNNLIGVGWQDICVRFHRSDPKACSLCHESDGFLNGHLAFSGDAPFEYRCKSNMIDIAAPVIIKGRHLATLFAGQFFYDDAPPDREFSRRQAAEFGFNAEEYLAALDRVPVFNREQIHGNILLLRTVLRTLVGLGWKNLLLAAEIAERKHTELALRESERKYRRIVDTANEGVLVVRPDSVITFLNSRMAELLGYPAEEILGRPLTEFMFAEDTPDLLLRLERGHQGAAEQYERRYRRKDGQQLWTLASFAPMFDEHREYQGAFAMLTDITERKRSEERLHRLNRELQAISNCNQVLMYASEEQSLLDSVCRIICEGAGYRMAWVGYAEQDAAKTVRPVAWAGDITEVLSSEDIRWSEENEGGRGTIGIAIRTGKTTYIQDFVTDPKAIPWRARAAERGYRSTVALPLKDEEGHTFGVLSLYSAEANAFEPEELRMLEELAGDLAFGITVIRARLERERAQETIALGSFTLNKMHEGAFFIGEQGQFQYVNEEACRSLGYSREELLTLGVPDIDPDFPRARWPQHWQEAQEKRSLDFETTHKEKNGHIHPVEISSNYLEYEGKSYLVSLSRDISERRRVEEEQAKLRQHLQQAQKMEAVGQLAGGVAHDFNNILGVINGYSEILLEDKAFPESYREAVGEILAAGHRAASLTRQLLAFSRKLVLKPQLLCFNSIIENFDKMLRRLIGEEIEVKTELEADLYQVKADPSQMEQVLLNFCINARDAMPEGGRITIRTENVDVDQTMAAQHPGLSPGQFVKLSVSDTGIGMDKETVSRVFEPFFTTKGPERGTGLGLATVYGIVKQSGGHVTVYSEPGEGSIFSVYLPIAAEQIVVKEQPQAMQELRGGTETIMLVEDEAALRMLYRKILEDKGYNVVEAEDGERAIQVAERYPGTISLLLSDVSLPKLKGPVMAKILQQQRPELKVLFISGHSGDILAGPDKVVPVGTDFLQKPFRTDDLLRKLRQMLDSREGASVWAA